MIKSIMLCLRQTSLTLSSFSGVLLFFFYLIADSIVLSGWLNFYLVKVTIALLMVVLFAMLALFLSKVAHKTNDNMKVIEVKPIESVAMPTYIGLFVIALGLVDFDTAQVLVIFGTLIVFWGFFERVFYFNPIWIFFGYRFYEVRTEKNTFTLISKRRNLKSSRSFDGLRKLNEYTYLEDENGGK